MTELWARIRNRDREERDAIHDQLRGELRELNRELASIEASYNMIEDEDLLDSLIYQRIGLMSRYNYLIKQAKKHCAARAGGTLPAKDGAGVAK